MMQKQRSINMFWVWVSHSGGYEECHLVVRNFVWFGGCQLMFRKDIAPPYSVLKSKPSKISTDGFLLRLLFGPEYGGGNFLRNVGRIPPNYTVLWSRISQFPRKYINKSNNSEYNCVPPVPMDRRSQRCCSDAELYENCGEWRRLTGNRSVSLSSSDWPRFIDRSHVSGNIPATGEKVVPVERNKMEENSRKKSDGIRGAQKNWKERRISKESGRKSDNMRFCDKLGIIMNRYLGRCMYCSSFI
jgi:hypothetical protein